MATLSIRAQEERAITTGLKDGMLVLLFTIVGYVITYLVTLLPFLDTFQQGKYAWVKPVIALLLGTAAKALDRKKHEDPTPSTGLIKI